MVTILQLADEHCEYFWQKITRYIKLKVFCIHKKFVGADLKCSNA